VDHQLAKFDPPADYHVVAGADHFWVGQEGEMAAKVVGFFRSHLVGL
jgi:alpha/beta superfamily hydrolase